MSTTIAPAFDGKTILIKTRPAPERFNSVHRSKTTVWALGGSEFTTERGEAARLAVHIYTSHDRNRRVYRSKTIRVTEELRGVERFLMFDEPAGGRGARRGAVLAEGAGGGSRGVPGVGARVPG